MDLTNAIVSTPIPQNNVQTVWKLRERKHLTSYKQGVLLQMWLWVYFGPQSACQRLPPKNTTYKHQGRHGYT